MSSEAVVPSGRAASGRSRTFSLAGSLLATASVFLLATFSTSCQGVSQNSTPPPVSAVTVSVSPASAAVSSGNNQQFTATVANTTNLAVSWSATAGTISSGGLLTAPSVSTTTTVVVTAVSQADSTKQATANVIVTPPGQSLSVQTSTLPSTTEGAEYLEPLIASGGQPPYQWNMTAGVLPQGIQLDPSDGAIAGAATVSGSFVFTVTATDAASHTASRQLTLTVAGTQAPLAVQTSTLPNATAGAVYLDTLVASGGQPPYQWSVSAGGLPTGIQLNTSSGAVSGTTSVSGWFSFVVTATDANSQMAVRELTLVVANLPSTFAVQTTTLPDATAGSAYLDTLAATGGQEPYTWGLTAGSLPAGIQLGSSGSISGTTSVAGSYTFTVTATDSASQTAERQLTLVTLPVQSNQPPIPSSLFGLQSRAEGGTYPTISFEAYRIWDTDVAWATLNPSSGTYKWANLDGILEQLESHGMTDGIIYTFGIVPNWASSAPADAACDSLALGGCDLPSDLNPDGTGTDQTFITYVKSIASHVNDPTYLETHAHVKYWEPWNEWYRDPVLSPYNGGCIAKQTCSIRASYAQMVRMTEDLRCVLTGTGSVNGVACSRAAIDPTAQILTPSSHGRSSFGVSVMENFLHCDSAPPSTSVCTTGDRGRNAIDILNFHFYAMLSETAEEIPFHVSNIKAGLRSADLSAMPLWSDEGGWGYDTSLTDPDLQEAFVVRYYLLGWSSGISRMVWYEFENNMWGTLYAPPIHGSLTQAGLAYQQIYDWMSGNAMSQACAGPAYPEVGVWTCGLTKPDGTQMLAVWDSSQSCSNGVCTTSQYTPDPLYITYLSLDGSKSSITGTVAIGAKPILLSQ